jgi:phosphatidylglycerol:prolipoprotein diacylglycerol transferase
MPEIPFLHPALLGLGVAGGMAWSALAPLRLAGPWAALAAGALLAATAGLAGWTPWLGHLKLTAYAACLGVAFLVAWWLGRRRARIAGISDEHVRLQLIIAAIGGILGARLWYIIEYRSEFPSPSADFAGWLTIAADLDRGGAVWFGGLLVATVAMVVHTRRSGVPLVRWADCGAPAVLAALAIGRLGCFANGCCFGRACELPWAATHNGVHVHPTQLYESLVCAVLAAVILRIPPDRGAAAGWSLLGYATWRFINETMRGDYDVKLGVGFSLSPFHLTSAQWFALPLAALGGWLLWRARQKAGDGR